MPPEQVNTPPATQPEVAKSSIATSVPPDISANKNSTVSIISKWIGLLFLFIVGGVILYAVVPSWHPASDKELFAAMDRDNACRTLGEQYLKIHQTEWSSDTMITSGNYPKEASGKCVFGISGELVTNNATSSRTIYYDSTNGTVLLDCEYGEDFSEICTETNTGVKTTSRDASIDLKGHYQSDY